MKYICDLAKQTGIKTSKLWLEAIPETIFLQKLREKYNVVDTEKIIAPVIGEYDDPFNQHQGVVDLNLSSAGNTIIYGNTGSGKETLLATLVYDVITTHKAEEVQFYLFDFGSEALKIFKGAPHVGDIVYISENEKISRCFEMLQKEIRRRIEILSDYGGDYNLYVKNGEEEMPMIVLVINNYEAFAETYEDTYEDIFLTLTREGMKCGIIFIITVSSYNDVRYRLAQNFKQKIALQLNNEDDYLNIWDRVGKKRPSHIFGRGLVKLKDDIYEFQVAKICEPEQWNKHIKDVIQALKKQSKLIAKPIPVLPDRVTIQEVKEYISDLSKVPIGINKRTLNVYPYNFTKNFINIITAKSIDVSAEFTLHILEVIRELKDAQVWVFDAERILQTEKQKLTLAYKNFILEMENNLNQKKQIVAVIFGIDKFINDIEDYEIDFLKMLKKARELGNYHFIIVDNFTRLKNHEYDEWYRSYCVNDNGIWIGNGVSEQYLISVNPSAEQIVNNCGNSFGYAIMQGEPTMIKLLGMNEKGGENG